MADEKRLLTAVLKCQHDGFGFELTAEVYADEIPLTCTPESDPAIMRVLRSTKGDFHAQEPLQRRTDCWHAPRA